MRQLEPLILREYYWSALEREIRRLLDELIYNPLLQILGASAPKQLTNSARALVSAIERGLIGYLDGRFHGEFSAATTRELQALGAEYHAASITWSLALEQLPAEISIAIAGAQARNEALRAEILQALSNMHADFVDEHSDAVGQAHASLDKMEGDFQRNVRSAVGAISIVPKLTDGQKRLIADEWGENLNLYVKGWAEENILRLRQQVQEHALSGGRSAGMLKMLQDNYALSRHKARFLARQETSLLLSKFAESRYRDVGIHKYRWQGAMDSHERPDHKALEGKVFTWDSPPVTDLNTRARNHPGEDFGCRCVAIPLLE